MRGSTAKCKWKSLLLRLLLLLLLWPCPLWPKSLKIAWISGRKTAEGCLRCRIRIGCGCDAQQREKFEKKSPTALSLSPSLIRTRAKVSQKSTMKLRNKKTSSINHRRIGQLIVRERGGEREGGAKNNVYHISLMVGFLYHLNLIF